jgi:hypothetical protein
MACEMVVDGCVVSGGTRTDVWVTDDDILAACLVMLIRSCCPSTLDDMHDIASPFPGVVQIKAHRPSHPRPLVAPNPDPDPKLLSCSQHLPTPQTSSSSACMHPSC